MVSDEGLLSVSFILSNWVIAVPILASLISSLLLGIWIAWNLSSPTSCITRNTPNREDAELLLKDRIGIPKVTFQLVQLRNQFHCGFLTIILQMKEKKYWQLFQWPYILNATIYQKHYGVLIDDTVVHYLPLALSKRCEWFGLFNTQSSDITTGIVWLRTEIILHFFKVAILYFPVGRDRGFQKWTAKLANLNALDIVKKIKLLCFFKWIVWKRH